MITPVVVPLGLRVGACGQTPALCLTKPHEHCKVCLSSLPATHCFWCGDELNLLGVGLLPLPTGLPPGPPTPPTSNANGTPVVVPVPSGMWCKWCQVEPRTTSLTMHGASPPIHKICGGRVYPKGSPGAFPG